MRVVDHDTVSIGRHADPREVFVVGVRSDVGAGEKAAVDGINGGRRVVMAFKRTTSSKAKGMPGMRWQGRGGRGKEERSEAGVRGENERQARPGRDPKATNGRASGLWPWLPWLGPGEGWKGWNWKGGDGAESLGSAARVQGQLSPDGILRARQARALFALEIWAVARYIDSAVIVCKPKSAENVNCNLTHVGKRNGLGSDRGGQQDFR